MDHSLLWGQYYVGETTRLSSHHPFPLPILGWGVLPMMAYKRRFCPKGLTDEFYGFEKSSYFCG